MNEFYDLLPNDIKPHEVSVLLVYSLGIHDAPSIAKFLHYQTNDTAYKVLREHVDKLPKFRDLMSPSIQLVWMS